MFAVGMVALTGRLRWHTDLEKVEADRDRWRDLALDLLQTNRTLAGAAGSAVEVVAATVPSADLGDGETL